MPSRSRCVEPELLDELPALDPRAQRSRRDLQRVHIMMRSVPILLRTVERLAFASQPARVIELGAGDGTLLLRFARALRPRWREVELTLLDRLDLVSDRTRAAYRDLGWRVTSLTVDALSWSALPATPRYDLCFANLFLHHFDALRLQPLLRTIAAASDAFVALEPRRSGLAHWGSRMVGLLGANQVTREDAVTSVAAGFTGHEISAAWGNDAAVWITDEFASWPFAHGFTAVRGGSARAS